MFVWKESFYFLVVLFLTIGLSALLPSVQSECSSDKDCQNSLCIASSCQCQKGFWGNRCEHCRLRLTDWHGIISDGKGKYDESAKCSWLVEPQRPNTTLLFNIVEFSTECSWDHLYIYDGNSIDAPLIAAISGLVKDKLTDDPVLTIEAKSGSAFLYFYSDANYSLNGFNITYRTIEDCTKKCNGNGRCHQSGHCVCETGWAGPSCDRPACSTTCEHGVCDTQTRQCNCYMGYTGIACSAPDGTPFWSSITANNQDDIFKRASHGAVVIGNYMWVVGGYSFNDFDRKNSFLARYNILRNAWEVTNKTLSSTHPGDRYGHSTVAYNNTIIIYGGDVDNTVVDELWSFDTNTFQWSQIQLSVDSNQPLTVVGHTAVIVNSSMVVLFGYSREEYFSGTVQEFDLDTRKWSRYSSPDCIRGRYGHSSVYHPGTRLIYVHGGFKQGSRFYSLEVSSDLLAYDPHKRSWYTLKSSGYPRFLHSSAVIGDQMFVFGGNTHNDSGKEQPKARCYSADFLTYDIGNNVWTKVEVSKSPPNLARYGHSAVVVNSRMYVFGGFSGVMFNDILAFTVGNCSKFKNESSCLVARNSSGCVWDQAAHSCIYRQYGNSSFKKETVQCGTQIPCSQENSCKVPSCNYSECNTCLVDRNCMWCESQQRCHSISTYVITFPYGQCHAWTDVNLGCLSTKCAHMKTCEDCHTLPGCGWCDDGSGTGLGQCLEGGDDGVKGRTINTSLVHCPKERWNFVGCPPCRCNGHSLCTNVSVCEDCQHNTRGSNCEYCRSGYYGDAKFGGRCKRCYCNDHGDTCDHRTGWCDCTEAAVTGKKCETCQKFFEVSDHSYLLVEGNATGGDHCYILVHPCFDCAATKFNVTSKSLICIQSAPYKDRDLEFAIEVLSKSFVYLNFSIVSDVMSERVLESELRIGSYKHVLSHKSYNFDGSVKIRVCVYNIQPPLAFAILFYQPTPLLDLLVFFITFFGCFFSLLLVAGFVWKIRSRWVRHLSSMRRLEEQAQRASRPFTKLILEFPRTEDCPTKSAADAIAWEPCADGKTAVTTVLMRLPTTENGCAPIGESGLTCASALITLNQPSSTGLALLTRRKGKSLPKQRQTTCL